MPAATICAPSAVLDAPAGPTWSRACLRRAGVPAQRGRSRPLGRRPLAPWRQSGAVADAGRSRAPQASPRRGSLARSGEPCCGSHDRVAAAPAQQESPERDLLALPLWLRSRAYPYPWPSAARRPLSQLGCHSARTSWRSKVRRWSASSRSGLPNAQPVVSADINRIGNKL